MFDVFTFWWLCCAKDPCDFQRSVICSSNVALAFTDASKSMLTVYDSMRVG